MLKFFKYNKNFALSATPSKVQMQKAVLAFPKLAKRLSQRPKDVSLAIKYLEEMACHFEWKSINRIKSILDMTLIPLYDGIDFQQAPGMDIVALAKENNVVFVPNHQSHADYLLLNYILVSRFQMACYVAGGINLDIFPIGKLFRKGGCFFIRRSFRNDVVYKLTLEAYISFLLKDGELPIEFFFEGGRSRTGKLLPPKFGLFQLLIDIHATLPQDKPLMFIPVSIVHEMIPEQKALAQEVRGGKKTKESFSQLLKLYKFFKRRFGTVHIGLNPPISVSNFAWGNDSSGKTDLKKITQNLAFECYRSVGRGMMVTPSAILALVLLDEHAGALTWQHIYAKAKIILQYCQRFGIPLPPSLKGEKGEASLSHVLDLFVESKKIDKVLNEKLGHTYFVISKGARVEVMYFKNTILHHFLVPFFINSAWINVFNGTLKTPLELRNFFFDQRNQLKYEFYLPTLKELMTSAMEIISVASGREIKTLEDCFSLGHRELYGIADQVGVFSSSFRYISEAYYLSALTLKHFQQQPFKIDQFFKASKEIFSLEMGYGRLIKYSESYSEFLMRNSLLYFLNQKLLTQEDGSYQVQEIDRVEEMIAKYARDLANLLIFNMTLAKG